MKTPNELPRVRRRRWLAPELLENRMVLSSGQGSTFAIMPSAVTSVEKSTSVSFTMNSSMFTPATKMNGKMELGIDITAVSPSSSSSSGTSSTSTPTLKPMIESVTSSTGQVIHVEHQHYYAKLAKANHLKGVNDLTSAVLLTIPVPKSGQTPETYTVQVKGLDHTTGDFLLGFYLPGDVAGTGTVTSTDITTIKSLIGDASTNSNYNFDADVNRDGVINRADLKLAEKNLGASTQVSPVVSVNLNPASDPSLDGTTPYSTVNYAGEVTPNATVTFTNLSNNDATTTTTAGSNGDYSINLPLVSGSNTFEVTTQDAFGQSITGSITPVVYSPTSAATTPSTSS
jgi:Dockerin type I domain